MGDPAGIGPEILARSLLTPELPPCVVVGCPRVMARAFALCGGEVELRSIAEPAEARFAQAGERPVVNLIEAGTLDPPPPYGAVSAAAGQAAYAALRRAIELAKAGAVGGLVTAPLHKEALAAAGVDFPGHTEILAAYGGAERVAMMLANAEIRTVLVSIHVALRAAIAAADFSAQMRAIRFADEGGRALGFTRPRVAVAGLNPHAGEGGRFGREEIEVIAPAVRAAQAEGIDASGPWPGDTVFMQARQGRFDVVVAQYHDQGLIPVKYLGLEQGVNITLGLPFVRTSPDHGTAFDIAGRGIAQAESMLTAIGYAARLLRVRRARAAQAEQP